MFKSRLCADRLEDLCTVFSQIDFFCTLESIWDFSERNKVKEREEERERERGGERERQRLVN